MTGAVPEIFFRVDDAFGDVVLAIKNPIAWRVVRRLAYSDAGEASNDRARCGRGLPERFDSPFLCCAAQAHRESLCCGTRAVTPPVPLDGEIYGRERLQAHLVPNAQGACLPLAFHGVYS